MRVQGFGSHESPRTGAPAGHGRRGGGRLPTGEELCLGVGLDATDIAAAVARFSCLACSIFVLLLLTCGGVWAQRGRASLARCMRVRAFVSVCAKAKPRVHTPISTQKAYAMNPASIVYREV